MGKIVIEVVILSQEHEGGFFTSENPVVGMKVASTAELTLLHSRGHKQQQYKVRVAIISDTRIGISWAQN